MLRLLWDYVLPVAGFVGFVGLILWMFIEATN